MTVTTLFIARSCIKISINYNQMTYKELAPNLSKFIDEVDVTGDVKVPVSNAVNKVGDPELTSEKVNLVLPHLKWMGASKYPNAVVKKSVKEISKLAGVSERQVKMLKVEFDKARREKLASLTVTEV